MYSVALVTTIVIVVAKLVSQLRRGYLQWKWMDSSQSCWNILHMSVPRPFPFVTQARVSIMLLTIVAILAVDFPAFPRRFAKTETYGVGLMDVGVGLFLVSYGMVSPEARSAISSKLEWNWSLSKDLKGAIPLLVLGFGRLFTTSAVEYHLHTSEYGVHWNFFFTLALVKIICSILEPVSFMIRFRYFYGCLSIAIIVVYQVVLSYGGLVEYLVGGMAGDGSRGNLFDSNREGLLSCFGYVALYLASVQFGKTVFQSRMIVKSWVKDVLYIVCITGMGWTLAVACHIYVQPVSRRFANLAFYLWILSVGMTAIVLYMVVDVLVLLLCHHLILPYPPGLFRQPKKVFYTVKLISEVPQVGEDNSIYSNYQQVCELYDSPKNVQEDEDDTKGQSHSSRGSSEGPYDPQKWMTERTISARRASWQVSSLHRQVVDDQQLTAPVGTDNTSFDFNDVSQTLQDFSEPKSSDTLPAAYLSYLKEHKTSSYCCLISAIGQNQLFFFLLGNLLTGLVNLSFDTLNAGSFKCVCILLVYLFVLSLVSHSAQKLGIKTKIW
jgi:hypothetical protein